MNHFDAILIDDDPLVRMSWKMVAQKKAKVFLAFSTVDEFLGRVDEIDRTSPIYLDSNLGGAVRGEEFAQELAKLGFFEVYLATGYRSADLSSVPGVKGVVGKDPPF